ncbi:hypothetical protein [Heyndrickxia acidicola]|uniref:Uncharacterized protein n=1 Tax=Heyndrickxia acidicola TaxID=209389 RepID=A0ABU6MF28_9BACI|nr:hypothetical protein [Heyndrickxia acidicola]
MGGAWGNLTGGVFGLFTNWLKRISAEQNKRVYDLIFPFFMIWIIPPLIILALAGNYIVDGLVIFIVLRLNKIKIKKAHWGLLTKMWAMGLLVDVVGMIALLLTVGDGPNAYTIWNDAVTAIGFVLVVLVCGLIIGWANYTHSKKYISDRRVNRAIGISMGILTAPWTFLIPTTWVY